MTPSLAPDFIPEIQVVHDRIMTTSLAISNVFEKNHRDVLRSIKDLEIPEDYRERNFAPTFREVPGPNGSLRKEPMYLITRDGFTILAMGFTGKKAMEFKIKYIEAFNRMEEELRRRKENPRNIEAPPVFPSQTPLTFEQQVALNREIEKKVRILPDYLHDTATIHIWKGLLAYLGLRERKRLPQHRFSDALAYIRDYPLVRQEACSGGSVRIGVLPRPEGSPGLESARNTLRYFEEWGRDLPEPARTSFLELVEDLKRSVVHDWSALDEACLRIGTGLAMLRRFRG